MEVETTHLIEGNLEEMQIGGMVEVVKSLQSEV